MFFFDRKQCAEHLICSSFLVEERRDFLSLALDIIIYIFEIKKSCINIQ